MSPAYLLGRIMRGAGWSWALYRSGDRRQAAAVLRWVASEASAAAAAIDGGRAAAAQLSLWPVTVGPCPGPVAPLPSSGLSASSDPGIWRTGGASCPE